MKKDKRYIGIQIPLDVYEYFKAQAEKNYRTLSNEVRMQLIKIVVADKEAKD